MNLLEKLNKVRVDLFNANLKKSGYNSFGKWSYFELGDLLPFINKACLDIGLTNVISFTSEFATLTIKDSKEEKEISFSVPWVDATLKGATLIQAEGATITYLRRYLYMTAYEIVESDWIDAQSAKEAEEAKKEAEQAEKDKNWKAFIEKEGEAFIKWAEEKGYKIYGTLDRAKVAKEWNGTKG